MKKLLLSVVVVVFMLFLYAQTDFDQFKKQEETKQQNFMETESKARAN